MSDQTILITGCSSGFGRELVSVFLEKGWTVIATMRRANERQSLFQSEQTKYGNRLRIISLDVTNAGDRAVTAALIQTHCQGKLDCLVNNAGYGLFGAMEDLSEAQIRAIMDVNFFGLLLLTKDLLPALRKARGRVINISSVLGYLGMPLSSLYCASKFAVEGLSEALYHELQPHGVQVAIVEPGRFRTDFGHKQVWGEGCFDADSPYAAQTAAYHELRNKMVTGQGNPVTPVIKAIARLAEMKTMPLRVRCGTDAKQVYALKRLLPAWATNAIFSKAFHKIFKTKPVR